MFLRPYLQNGQCFPELPVHDDAFQSLIKVVGIDVDPSKELTLQLTEHARDNWLLPQDLQSQPGSTKPYSDAPEHEAFRQAGMIDPVPPRRDTYDTLLLDGGPKDWFDYRLACIDKLSEQGL